MSKQTMMGGITSSFAHLVGIPLLGKKAEDEDTRKDEDAKAKAAEDDEDEDDKKDKEAKSKADDDTDAKSKAKAKAEDDDDDDDKDKDKEAKSKAKDDNEEGGDDYKDGKKAERARWSKVLASAAAGLGRAAAACEMLSGTNMSATAIIRTLGALPEGPATSANSGLKARMGGIEPPKIGGDGGKPATAIDSFAAEMAAATKQARG